MEIGQVLAITVLTLHTILFAIFIGFVVVNMKIGSKKLFDMLKMFLVFGTVQFVIIFFEAFLHIIGSKVDLHIVVLIFTIPVFCAFCVFAWRNIKLLNNPIIGIQAFSIIMFILIHVIYVINYDLMEEFELLETMTILLLLLSGYFAVIRLIIDFRK